MATTSASRRVLLAAAMAAVGTGLGTAALSPDAARAGSDSGQIAAPPDMAARIQGFIPEMEAEIARGMKLFDAPGLAIGIVCEDQLVYASGFGVCSRKTNSPVGTGTLFQIGSTSKAFLAATLALMVDRGHLRWDDRIVDLDPEFALSDPWVTDRMLDNPTVDYIGIILKGARDRAADSARTFARPANPRPAPPLSPLAGRFANPAIGGASVAVDGTRLVMTLEATGARLSIQAWDGDVFTARLLEEGRFAGMAENFGPAPNAFVQYQIGDNGGLDRLKLSMDDGQAYVFTRTPAPG